MQYCEKQHLHMSSFAFFLCCHLLTSAIAGRPGREIREPQQGTQRWGPQAGEDLLTLGSVPVAAASREGGPRETMRRALLLMSAPFVARAQTPDSDG